jgi:hypothetical protein
MCKINIFKQVIKSASLPNYVAIYTEANNEATMQATNN